jgi:hypothetical protein
LDATEENPDQSKEDPDQQAYTAFVTAQNATSKEEYEHFKSRYAASTCFGNMKICFQTFASGFQVTSAHCLGDQTIENLSFVKTAGGILQLQGRRLKRRLSKLSSQRSPLATSAGSLQVTTKKATMLLAMLFLLKRL